MSKAKFDGYVINCDYAKTSATTKQNEVIVRDLLDGDIDGGLSLISMDVTDAPWTIYFDYERTVALRNALDDILSKYAKPQEENGNVNG